jgi:AAA family ATP:ADP antiporter
MTRGSRLFDIRPEERRNTFAAFATLLAITTGHTLLETARDAFFLAKMPASRLPWMYLVIVACALLLSRIRAARADGKVAVAGSLVVAALITGAFWTVMRHGTATPLVLYALYVWTGLFASWAMVQVWTLLGRAHTMTQAKRLYGFIGAGAVLGGVLGAIVARVAITAMSARSAVLLAAGLFVVAAAPCLLITLPPAEAPSAPRRGTEAREAPRRRMSATMRLLWENPFAVRVLALVLVATVTVTIADYLFKARIAESATSTKQLIAWLSTFYAVTNALALVAQLVLAPWLFRRVGVQRALFVFPLALLAAAAGVVLSAGALGAAVALKGLDGVLRYSIHKTSTELLLVPVPDGVRERLKPVIDLVGSRGGQALASVVILGLVASAAAQTVVLGAIVGGLGIAWVVLVFRMRASYLDVFRETLKTGGLSGRVDLPALDLNALETLFTGLNSAHDSDVIASLELLAEQRRERLIPALILYHPSREVVLRALEIFTEMGRTDFVTIADRLNAHPDREVASAALRARTTVLPERELLLERLRGACPQVSCTALVALMTRGWMAPDEIDQRLGEVMTGQSWQSIAELARSIRVLARVRGDDDILEARFDDLLVAIDARASAFHDAPTPPVPATPATPGAGFGLGLGPPDVRVRLEVARAMEVRHSARFVPLLVAMLRWQELRAAARRALVSIPGALAALDQAMATPELPPDIRVQLPRTIALFEPSAAAEVLMRHLTEDRGGATRWKTLRGLVRLRRERPEIDLDPSALLRVADKTLEGAEELRRWRTALATEEDGAPGSRRGSTDPLRAAHHLLVDLVRDKEVHSTERLFSVLELLYGDTFDDIWRGLRSKSANARASSLELLENLVKPPLRERVLALVGEIGLAPSRVAFARATEGAPGHALTYEGAIRELARHHSGTLSTLARYRAVELGLDLGAIVVAPPRTAEESVLATTLGARLLGTARDLLAPTPEGGPRVPA